MQDIVFQFEKYYWTHSISLFPPQVHVGRSSLNFNDDDSDIEVLSESEQEDDIFLSKDSGLNI
ncbi:hypothetical protein SHM_21410 [Spiroplasma ixodetis]|uniref:Uncharacterized protein n=1 Tax=Spiroplasma ixodetis TaxID=2141 RepID=A0ABM8BXA2_9MOLU|nr:hypothetical protein SHM_21410 [Spiroplasma ixodetis]